VNIESYPFDASDDINSLAALMCLRVATVCRGDLKAQASCGVATAEADNKRPAPSGAQADAFNAVMGFKTNFAAIKPESPPARPIRFPF